MKRQYKYIRGKIGNKCELEFIDKDRNTGYSMQGDFYVVPLDFTDQTLQKSIKKYNPDANIVAYKGGASTLISKMTEELNKL